MQEWIRNHQAWTEYLTEEERADLFRLYESHCKRKIAYPSRREARRARKSTERGAGARFNIYACEFCGSFHVGHMNSLVLRGKAGRHHLE